MFPVDRFDLVERFVATLATVGVERGLIGPREAPRLWERHILNCAVLAPLLPSGASVCDVGSGAGLPGLVLSIVRPDLEVTLVEPLLRRTNFLEETVGELGLEGVSVHRGRADSLHGVRTYDVVTARAVASLDRLLDWGLPLVAPGGALVAMKGATAAAELAAAAPVLRRWGSVEAEVVTVGEGVVSPATTVVRVVGAGPTALSWPPPSASPASGGRRARQRTSTRSPRQQRSPRE